MHLTGFGVLLFVTIASAGDDSLDVCLQDLGCLRGTLMPGYKTKEFEAFMGIPFAQPPVGALRLKNPVAAAAWEGVLDAGTAKDGCLQRSYFSKDWDIMGVEDCLYLNVYRPKEREGDLLPVMVYIHAGGFFSGTAHPVVSGPEYLMDTGKVIMVTIAYRLGPFGFLSTGDDNMPGNFGFKDQRLALQWVQQHIEAFGGDPQSVTIFGHSAGGISAHLHMISPGSKGLFHRAMSLAGTMFIPGIKIHQDPLGQARQLAQVVGIDQAESLSNQDLAEALRDANPIKLLKSVDTLKIWDNMPQISCLPVVEREGSPDAFLVEDPLQAHLAGRINQMPWLLGLNSRAGEGSLYLLRAFKDQKLREEFNEKFLEHLALALNLPDGTPVEIVSDILAAYDYQSEMSLNNDTMLALAEISGDFSFYYPFYETISSYAGYADLEKSPMSLYIFEFRGLHSWTKVFSGSSEDWGVGAAHMDDAMHSIRMPFLFEDFPKDSEDAKVTERMTSLMVEFAQTGLFHKDTTCQGSDFGDQKMCNYLYFSGNIEKSQEDIKNTMKLNAFSIWQKLFV